jgi:xanthine dehydrogenase YagS FAD-binding subunit
MRAFEYLRAATPADAVRLVASNPQAKFVAGGTNLVDLMRERIELPETLIDVTDLSREVKLREDGGLRIGAGVKNTELAAHAAVRERVPMLARAVLAGASGQIRNMATVGGNAMQRTRCLYFYDDAARCNKRQPGRGCDAIDGFNRNHAILGASPACIATHPSDMCVALAALDAGVHVEGPQGARTIKFVDFHRLPTDRPDLETALARDELITAIEVPPLAFGRNSTYRKVRDRASYAFALVSVAAALDLVDGQVGDVRLALGGVAHKPWRAFQAEKLLRGAPATEESFRNAAEAELQQASGLQHNAFKIELAKRIIVQTLKDLSQGGQA